MKRIKVLWLVFALAFCAIGVMSSVVGYYTEVKIASASYIVKGNTPTNIKAVQTPLKNWGYYNGAVDGIWGSKTLAAVKLFQQKNGLIVDGIVGTKTEQALGINLSASGSSSSSISSADMDLLARCVHAEARGEPYVGQVAVAAVVLNRIRSADFPNTISGVIYQNLAFTAVADGQINLTANQSAKNATNDALNGWDPTNGCLYYYNPATATSKWIWSLKVELKIGKHNFAKGK